MSGKHKIPLFPSALVLSLPPAMRMSFKHCLQAKVGLPPNVLRYFRAKGATSTTKRSRRCQIDRQARSLLRAFRVSPLCGKMPRWTTTNRARGEPWNSKRLRAWLRHFRDENWSPRLTQQILPRQQIRGRKPRRIGCIRRIPTWAMPHQWGGTEGSDSELTK